MGDKQTLRCRCVSGPAPQCLEARRARGVRCGGAHSQNTFLPHHPIETIIREWPTGGSLWLDWQSLTRTDQERGGGAQWEWETDKLAEPGVTQPGPGRVYSQSLTLVLGAGRRSREQPRAGPRHGSVC